MFSSTVEITAARTYPLYARSNISHYQQQPLVFFCSYFTGPVEEYKAISFTMDVVHATACTWLLPACLLAVKAIVNFAPNVFDSFNSKMLEWVTLEITN